MQEISHRFIRTLTSVQYKSNIILLQGGELMDERNNDFDFDFMPIGQAIKKAREARGMTREQLAGIIGYAPRHIQSIENEGQHPSIELFIQLITCLLYTSHLRSVPYRVSFGEQGWPPDSPPRTHEVS